MGLPGNQQAILAQIDARLESENPELARRLRSMRWPGGERPAGRRPPRVVVALAAALACAAVFLATVIAVVVPQPCRTRPNMPGGHSAPATRGHAASGADRSPSAERGPADVPARPVPITARC